MTFGYDGSDVHLRYDVGRALSRHSTDALMKWLAYRVPRPLRLIIDLGCGTGRPAQEPAVKWAFVVVATILSAVLTAILTLLWLGRY
jgi:hypothetical protein